MPCPNRQCVKTYLTPDEYTQLKNYAGQAGISVSTYIKRICLGIPVCSIVDQKAILALLRANADMGRLGGLFKKAISEGYSREMQFDFIQLLRKIESSRINVERCCQDIVDKIKKYK